MPGSTRYLLSLLECRKEQIHKSLQMKKHPKMVRFEAVSFTYQEAREPALENISFAVKRGETVGIIGGTGSGKSTLVSLIPRFYDGNSGQMLVDGQTRYRSMHLPGPAGRRSGLYRRRRFSFRERSGKISAGRRKERFGRRNLAGACYGSGEGSGGGKKSGGLDATGRQPVERNFSGGQRQRLTIARALVSKSGDPDPG